MVLLTDLAAKLQQMQMPSIPLDTAVRVGKLPNGLTYYVRHNDYPAHRANFYIAQRVGSIQENDEQRGLAHFLEHMCFNGTRHYANDQLIRYLETLGVQFGSNLNAFTSIDRTVYRICNVPTTNQESLDSCMLILRDWSCDLILDSADIEKERKVIHEEWRMRTNASLRLLERNLPELYPGSKYGLRMPIGKMDIIDHFKPKELRDYYEKWYRPDNQGIIIVGDIDVDQTEEKIRTLFADIPVKAGAAQVVDEVVPDNDDPIIIVDNEKEQQYGVVDLMFKHDIFEESKKTSLEYTIYKYASDVVSDMLNQRFIELSQNADCPFAAAECGNGKYIFAKTKSAFDLSAMPKEGQVEQTLASLFRETMRARLYGFTPTEYQRARATYLSRLDKDYTNRNKRDNNVWGDLCRDNFLDHEPIPDMERLYALLTKMIPEIPVEVVNAYFREWISSSDSNIVVMNFNNEREGTVYPSRESLKRCLDHVRREQLTAFVDNVKDEPLIKKIPARGSIVQEKENVELGFKELSLSNGATVILKKTDYKDDEIKMDARSEGGSSLYDENDFANIQLFDDAISISGLGAFNSTELTKILAGKEANVNLYLKTFKQTATGHCTPKDIVTMLQMTYLYFTDIQPDEAAFRTLMKQKELMLKNKELSPEQIFQDALKYTRFNYDWRFAPLSVSNLKGADYHRILQMAKDRFGNAANFTFTFCGNFDEDVIRPLVERYIASLPSETGKKETYRDVIKMHQGELLNHFSKKMQVPKAMAYILWHTDETSYSLRNVIMADVVGQILDMLYIRKIREESCAAYSTGAYGFVQQVGTKSVLTILGGCPMKPEKRDVAVSILRNEIKNVAQSTDASMLQKVKEYMLKKADEEAKKNDHWFDVIYDYRDFGIDMQSEYKSTVVSVTPEEVSTFVKEVLLKTENRTEVIMMPE